MTGLSPGTGWRYPLVVALAQPRGSAYYPGPGSTHCRGHLFRLAWPRYFFISPRSPLNAVADCKARYRVVDRERTDAAAGPMCSARKAQAPGSAASENTPINLICNLLIRCHRPALLLCRGATTFMRGVLEILYLDFINHAR